MTIRKLLNIRTLLLVVSLILLSYLRIKNLGYSEYIPDETTILNYFKEYGLSFHKDFFLSQSKGPLQFLVVFIPYYINSDVFNAGAFRMFFSLANIIGLFVFFLFVKNQTKNYWVGLLAMLILGLNGLLVAFGRVVQYQSLNLLFSSLCLYYFSKFDSEKIGKYKNSLIGTLFFSISLLSHWDAVFVLPVIFYLVFKFILSFGFALKYRVRVAVVNIGLLLILLMPFMLPYASNYFSNLGAQSYFNTRIALADFSAKTIQTKIDAYYFRSELYNPFFYLLFLVVAVCFSIFTLKDSRTFAFWFLCDLLLFLIFVLRSGTHVYNLYYPLSVLASLGLWNILKVFKGYLKVIPAIALLIPLVFFWYQNYLLFVDYKTEYPWQQELVYKYPTKIYTHKELTNNVIGFPLKRNWMEISNIINEDLAKENKEFKYITNEDTSISGFYIDLPYGNKSNMYVIGIKRPFSFVNDYTFPQVKNKYTIHTVAVNDETVVRIYKVTEDDKN